MAPATHSRWRSLTTLVERAQNFSPMVIFCFVVGSYFIATSGIAYDIINEAPAIGGTQDPRTGAVKPQAIVPGRINAQYIMEGVMGGFFYTLGGLGVVLLDLSQDRKRDPVFRNVFRILGFGAMLMAYAASMMLLRVKMPGYLVWHGD